MRSLLILLLALALCADARADAPSPAPSPPTASSAPPMLGPIVTATEPDGFTLRLGHPQGLALPATLQVLGQGGAVLLTADSPPSPWHTLRAYGLPKGQRYRYRVLLDGQHLTDGEVDAAPPPARPLRVLVFGDERGLRSGIASGTAAIATAVLREDPDLVLGTGDLLAEGGDLDGWREVAEAHRALFAQVLYLPALGNHELINDPEARTFRSFFPQADRRYYKVQHGRVLVIALDSNRPNEPAQTRFLAAALRAAPPNTTRIVILHHPPFSVGAHCGSWQEIPDWLALFERHRVDLVIGGHDHAYQRAERNGVAYFVSGGGGAPLYDRASCPEPDEAAVQHYRSAYHYLRVDIDAAGAVSVTARGPGALPFDQVRLPLPPTQTPVLPPRPAFHVRPAWRRRWPLLLVPVAPVLIAVFVRARRRRAKSDA